MANRKHISRPEQLAIGIYYLVLAAMLLTAYFPEGRVWGINWWAYYPTYVPPILFIVGALVPIAVVRWLTGGGSSAESPDGSADRRYRVFAISFTIICAILFVLMRTRTHFLGDGYTLLSLLADDNPLVKPRELGESWAHIWLKNLIGGDAKIAALFSYRCISIAAGIIFVAVAAWSSRKLFERNIDRVLFLAGLCSGGYMLLFFGYVENYSLFVLSVAVFTLIGLLISRGAVNRWLSLPLTALAIFFHILGVTLLPSAVYLLVHDTRLSNQLIRLPRVMLVLVTAVGVVIATFVFGHHYSTNLFFKLAIVPLLPNEFTVGGYTLFSFSHLSDIGNLLILLVPGIMVTMPILLRPGIKQRFRAADSRFLILLIISTAGAAFIFDPKLGMPRDWDLFAFVGVPVATLLCYKSLSVTEKSSYLIRVIALASVLNLSLLLPRAVAQIDSKVGISHFESYIDMDHAKNRTAPFVLVNYYTIQGETTQGEETRQSWERRYPEKALINEATSLQKQGRIFDAITMLRRVIEQNPLYYDAWSNLGECFISVGQFDSAVSCIRLADALNPYNSRILSNLGAAFLFKGIPDSARLYLERALERDSTHVTALLNMADLYRDVGQPRKYLNYLIRAASQPKAAPTVLSELAGRYLQMGDTAKARETYRIAVDRGMDSSIVNELLK